MRKSYVYVRSGSEEAGPPTPLPPRKKRSLRRRKRERSKRNSVSSEESRRARLSSFFHDAVASPFDEGLFRTPAGAPWPAAPFEATGGFTAPPTTRLRRFLASFFVRPTSARRTRKGR